MTTTENTFASTYVIASCDEGVQLNSGTRFGFAGSGYQLPHFTKALKALAKSLATDLKLISSQEDDWLLTKLESKNPNLYRETLEKLATTEKISYIGQLDFGDPRTLDDDLTKGHLVRPPKIHVADSICFTCGGGEQVFNLRNLVISADYVSDLSKKEIKELIGTQVDFFETLLGRQLDITFELKGVLGDKKAQKNKKALLGALPNLIK